MSGVMSLGFGKRRSDSRASGGSECAAGDGRPLRPRSRHMTASSATSATVRPTPSAAESSKGQEADGRSVASELERYFRFGRSSTFTQRRASTT